MAIEILKSPSRSFLEFVRDQYQSVKDLKIETEEKQVEEVNYPGLLREVMETQKKFNEMSSQNGLDELENLYKITKENISSYKQFMFNIKNNLTTLNKIMIKCEHTPTKA